LSRNEIDSGTFFVVVFICLFEGINVFNVEIAFENENVLLFYYKALY
jgi:hypothetical protein